MKIEIPIKLQPLFKPKRFKVMFGGRGGYKTMSISKALCYLGGKHKKRILCLREYMNSIDDSVHSSISDEIETLKMSHLYNVTNNKIDGTNGTAFRYFGLSRNIASIKSKHKFDIAWIEEAETVTQKSLDILIPTIVRNEGAELWFSFNPEDEFGAVYSRFVKPHLDEIKSKGFYEDENLFVVQTSLDDNPFPNPGLEAESKQMKEDDYKKWLWIYGGECYSDYKDSIISPEWVDASINSHVKLGFKPLGVKSQGFDLADTGDAKALMHRHGSVITNNLRWDWGELPEAIDQAFESADKDRSEFMIYDDDGLGKSMKVYLANVTTNKSLKVVPYNGNASVDNPSEVYNKNDPSDRQKTNKEMFKNKRAQYYRYLADRFEATYNAVEKGIYTDPQDLISLSPDLTDLDILKSELIKIKRVRGNNSFYQIQSKKDAMKEGIKSPNMADALKMCFANPAPEPKTVVLNFESEW